MRRMLMLATVVAAMACAGRDRAGRDAAARVLRRARRDGRRADRARVHARRAAAHHDPAGRRCACCSGGHAARHAGARPRAEDLHELRARPARRRGRSRRSPPTASSTSTTRSTSSTPARRAAPRRPVNRVSRFIARATATSSTRRARSCWSTTSPRRPATTTPATCSSARTATSTSASATAAATTPARGCAGANDAARDQHVLLGKILRITRVGRRSRPTTRSRRRHARRCNVTGRRPAGKRCQETFAWGLRNPFRIAFDPNAAGTRFYINDVGQSAWEEIDLGAAGADYGWNVREGHCATGSTTNCGAPPAGMTNPIFDYGRSDGCASITGGAFVPERRLAGRLRRRLPVRRLRLREDLPARAQRRRRLQPRDVRRRRSAAAAPCTWRSARRRPARRSTTRPTPAAAQVRRIVFAGANRAPTADVTASPTSGAAAAERRLRRQRPAATPTRRHAHLPVGLRRRLAGDRDGGADDVAHLRGAGTYTATLRVRDNHGADVRAGHGAHRRRQHPAGADDPDARPRDSASPSARRSRCAGRRPTPRTARCRRRR